MSIGVVAIGRNEGERLRACLQSARRDCAAVVYVDSGSTDGSVQLAASLGAAVVSLDLSIPFTAARARNEGFAKLRELDPAIEFVQFVDGDCEIVSGWIATAERALRANAKLAVVCGRRRERFPDATVYNRLCDMEWDTPVGEAKACGGDALIRRTAFEEAGGYDASVIAGEEPEMCVRLRSKGWLIHRIDAEMTLHDAAMTRFSQWWTRNVRAGHAYAQNNAMHGGPPERFREREVRSTEFWAMAPIIATAGLTILLAIVRPHWCWLGAVPLLGYPLLVAKVTRSRLRRKKPLDESLLYAVAVTVAKFPQHLGIRKYRGDVRAGRKSAIIEYKHASAPGANTAAATTRSLSAGNS